MRNLKQSTAANVVVFMTDSTDHVTGKTGLTLTITASKDGAAFASISPTVTELATGWYKLALTSSHTDTLGDLALHITATGADPTDFVCRVVAVDLADSVRFGLTALPNAAAGASSGLPLAVDASGRVDVLKINGTSQTARDIGASVLVSSGTGAGQISLSSGAVTVGTNNDKTGYTASTVTDKTGYSLTQAFPTNFASLSIDGSGFVVVATNNDKTGYTASTVSDKTGYSLSTAGVDAILDEVCTELTAVTSADDTLRNIIALLHMWVRNNNTATASARTIKNDAGSTVASATCSDNGTTYSQGKLT